MMIGYGRQYIDNDDIKAVTKVLKSNLITQGSNVKKFRPRGSKSRQQAHHCPSLGTEFRPRAITKKRRCMVINHTPA